MTRHHTQTDFTQKHSKLRQEISENTIIQNKTNVKGVNKTDPEDKALVIVCGLVLRERKTKVLELDKGVDTAGAYKDMKVRYCLVFLFSLENIQINC